MGDSKVMHFCLGLDLRMGGRGRKGRIEQEGEDREKDAEGSRIYIITTYVLNEEWF